MDLEALTHFSGSSSGSQSSTLKRNARANTVAGLAFHLYQRLRHYVFTLFAAVNSCPAAATSSAMAVVLLSIETLQTFWFALSTVQHFPWNSEYISWLLQIVKIVRFDIYINGDKSMGHLAAIIVVFVFCLLMLTTGAFLVYQLQQLNRSPTASRGRSEQAGGLAGPEGAGLSAQGSSIFDLSQRGGRHQRGQASSTVQDFARLSTLLSVFTMALKMASTVLFMPIIAILATPLRSFTSSSLLSASSESSVEVNAKIALGLCGIVMFLPLAAAFTVLKWPRNLVIPALCGGAATGPRQAAVAALEGLNVQADRQYDALDRPHSRFMLLQQVLRLALTVMFAIITSTAIETHWALCLFFVASCALNLICCLWYMPFLSLIHI